MHMVKNNFVVQLHDLIVMLIHYDLTIITSVIMYKIRDVALEDSVTL